MISYRLFLFALAMCLWAFLTFFVWQTAVARTTTQILADIRECESGGDYTAINGAFSEYHFDRRIGSFGAYQIGQGTWDWLGNKRPGWELLVGFRPDWAEPAIQDMVAQYLLWLEYNDDQPGVGNYSWSHWGNC